MVIRNHDYYVQFEEILEDSKKELDYCIKMAKAYRDLAKATKNRRGIWQSLYKFAVKRNQVYREKGYKIAKIYLGWCLCEINYLRENYF